MNNIREHLDNISGTTRNVISDLDWLIAASAYNAVFPEEFRPAVREVCEAAKIAVEQMREAYWALAEMGLAPDFTKPKDVASCEISDSQDNNRPVGFAKW